MPYLNASSIIFGGLRMLLDEQTNPERRRAAGARLNKYAGVENGYQPVTDALERYASEQMAKPAMTFPSKTKLKPSWAETPTI